MFEKPDFNKKSGEDSKSELYRIENHLRTFVDYPPKMRILENPDGTLSRQGNRQVQEWNSGLERIRNSGIDTSGAEQLLADFLYHFGDAPDA